MEAQLILLYPVRVAAAAPLVAVLNSASSKHSKMSFTLLIMEKSLTKTLLNNYILKTT